MSKYSRQKFRTQKGFTIIELLIVIVVIGILATITITVFQNTRGKAQAAVAKNIVQQYSKALVGYKATYGEYPDIANLSDVPEEQNGVCLGTGYGVGACGSNFGPGIESAEFNELMKDFIGKVPDIRPHITAYSFPGLDLTLNGVLLQDLYDPADNDLQIDNQPVAEGTMAITYGLEEPGTDCVGGKVLLIDSIPSTSYSTTTSQKYTITDGKNTGCFVLLPN